MLSRERVVFWVALFGERMGREFSAPTFVEYVDALVRSPLDSVEFESAARSLYAREKWLPVPAEFYYTARPAERPAAKAAAALAALRGSLRHWTSGTSQGYGIEATAIPDAIRGPALAAYKAAGGTTDKLADGSNDFGFVQAFTKFFVAAADADVVDALLGPAPADVRRLPAANG